MTAIKVLFDIYSAINPTVDHDEVAVLGSVATARLGRNVVVIAVTDEARRKLIARLAAAAPDLLQVHDDASRILVAVPGEHVFGIPTDAVIVVTTPVIYAVMGEWKQLNDQLVGVGEQMNALSQRLLTYETPAEVTQEVQLEEPSSDLAREAAKALHDLMQRVVDRKAYATQSQQDAIRAADAVLGQARSKGYL
jgi:hypothetical protein